ncbi:DUF2867 domain-containing protein [Aequorivita sp. SDUM287046]|uniref:DUF2867 domain-containing protein n=1 Tax=Aequorivita aurantiaca TaxID=3053356 RepID=A0ABT8DJV5_9FLAO|nr:DUF2867 domain-containing protein [Aequorivita aurantiaca]MDN3724264.1 DUF2867 domain-containing protein [Aequorivita aurantiaca]
MAISATDIPPNSLLKAELNYDYIDSFQGYFNDPLQKIGITDIGKSFFSSGPKWIDGLFEFRNKLVGLFGLKTSGKITNRQKMLEDFKCEKGEQMGLFKVLDKTNGEIILGEDDKHLNFRISLLIVNQNQNTIDKLLIITTAVKFNNWFGRLYFIPVRPFHKLIVPVMLKGIVRNVENMNFDTRIKEL